MLEAEVLPIPAAPTATATRRRAPDPVPLPPPPPSPPIIRYRRVLKLVPTIPYVPIACQDGTRVYLRLFPEKEEESFNLFDEASKAGESVIKIPKTRPYRSLLGVDFQELRREANGIVSIEHQTLQNIT